MTDTWEFLKSFAQFPLALHRFLRPGLTLAQARDILQRRLAARDERFLAMARATIYGHAPSPYLRLLRMAGCEYGDLGAEVNRHGLEAALRRLRQAGVYVSFEEFKGRKPIVRGGTSIEVTPRDFDNPVARRDFALTTGGSTGVPSAVFQDLDHIAAGAPHQMAMLDAWGVLDAPAVHWMQTLPGGGLRFVLQRAYFDRGPERWFSPNPWRDSNYWLKYSAASLYMIFWMRALGVRVHVPEVVGTEEARVIARYLHGLLRSRPRCLLYTSVSRGLRVCLAAVEEGLALNGLTIRAGGEPVTDAKAGAMRRGGARVLPAYGAIDTGSIGLGCARPEATDDLHFCSDAFALITHPHAVGESSVPAFNLTSLLDTSSKVMLNYESDDYGVVSERRCGCPLGELGFTTHLHGIRSYSKLVGEAVTLIGNDMVEILEKHLPARFGGGPLDYQLMEEEDAHGFTRLSLIVDPAVPVADEAEVIAYVHHRLAQSSPMGDAAGRVWRQSGAMRVRRMKPVWTARGKLLPLHPRPSGSGE